MPKILKATGDFTLTDGSQYDLEFQFPLDEQLHYDSESINLLLVQLPFEWQAFIEQRGYLNTFNELHATLTRSSWMSVCLDATVNYGGKQAHVNGNFYLLKYNITRRNIGFVLGLLPQTWRDFIEKEGLVERLDHAVIRLGVPV